MISGKKIKKQMARNKNQETNNKNQNQETNNKKQESRNKKQLVISFAKRACVLFLPFGEVRWG